MTHLIHVGTQKAASSFLRGLLAQVSEVGLACRQELNFFGFVEDQSLDAYLECFPEKRPVLFDNSPVYFRNGSRCAEPIAKTLGNERLVLSLLLRDPVDAIISHHQMRLRQGFFVRDHSFAGDPLDLAAFIERNPAYIDDWRYASLLQSHWLKRFPIQRFHIRTFEEFTASPAAAVEDLLVRVGVESVPGLRTDQVWKNQRPASKLANWLLQTTKRNGILRNARHRAMAIRPLRRFSERLLFESGRTSGREQDSQVAAKAEVAAMLRPEVERLCELLGRDSLPWRNFFPQAGRRATASAGVSA